MRWQPLFKRLHRFGATSRGATTRLFRFGKHELLGFAFRIDVRDLNNKGITRQRQPLFLDQTALTPVGLQDD
jgi:hypothetical protein